MWAICVCLDMPVSSPLRASMYSRSAGSSAHPAFMSRSITVIVRTMWASVHKGQDENSRKPVPVLRQGDGDCLPACWIGVYRCRTGDRLFRDKSKARYPIGKRYSDWLFNGSEKRSCERVILF